MLTADFSRGVELLADNELHPALPAQAFDMVKRRTTEFVAGNLQEPRVSDGCARSTWRCCRPEIRFCGEATPATVANVTLEAVRAFYAATCGPDLTTIVVIGDVSAEEARSVVERWFGGWHAERTEARTTLAARSANQPAVAVDDPQAIQDSVYLAEQLNRTGSPRLLSARARQLRCSAEASMRRGCTTICARSRVMSTPSTCDSTASQNPRELRGAPTAVNPENVSKARGLIERDLEQMRSRDVSDEGIVPGEGAAAAANWY